VIPPTPPRAVPRSRPFLLRKTIMMASTLRVCIECGQQIVGRPKSQTCSVICRFWSLVDRSGGPDACWPWLSHVCQTTGYGDVPARYNGGTRTSAHRLAWRLYNCADPGTLCILHRCDRRDCCNPKHLFLGTRKANLYDAWKKGHLSACSPGQDHPRAKLTDAVVREIRSGDEDARVLSQRHGVKPQTIRSARSGRTWRHLEDEPPILPGQPDANVR
jgi:hypothetical protein